MKSIYGKFADAAAGDMQDYYRIYMSAIIDLYKDIYNPKNLVSKIDAKNPELADTYLRFSLVFNDITLYHHPLGNDPQLIMLQPDWFEMNNMQKASLSISAEHAKKLELDLHKPALTASFIFPSGSDYSNFADQLLPFIETGKLVLQPDRCVLTQGKEPNSHQTIDIDDSSPLDAWELIDESRSRPVEITNSNVDGEDKELFQVVMPYFENVPFMDLAKVLADEEDLISQLRSVIKEAIIECKASENLDEVRRDLIDPKVDALNRRFKTIVDNYFYKIAAAGVGTAVLAYTAVSTAGMSSALTAITGSGGFGLLAKEFSDYKKDMNQVKDEPYYLLWRIKNCTSKYT